MTRRTQDLLYEAPRRPEPKTFRIDRALDPLQMEYLRRNPADFRRALKVSIARELAAYIADETQFLDVSSVTMRDPTVRIELTLNDRGSYANWLPQERREGHSEGVKRTLALIPYGMNPLESFE